MLLRHWTLYESIENSNYIVSKMSVWTEPGKKEMRRFLAKLAIPLDQAQQKYSFMEPQMKRELKRKIMDVSEDFGLDEIIMNGYVRQFNSCT